jgi:cell division septum initiation protein DivIVA
VGDKNRSPKRDALETSTAERLAAIVEAAEQAATKVIDDAEEEARRYLADARREAEEILGRAERLLDSLTAAKDRLRSELEAGGEIGEGPGLEPRTHLSAVPAEAEDEPPVALAPSPEPRRAPANSPAGARLLATQMAVSGNSREEIAARLRNGFQIEDTDAILDAILGAEEI